VRRPNAAARLSSSWTEQLRAREGGGRRRHVARSNNTSRQGTVRGRMSEQMCVSVPSTVSFATLS
jgi:hypothetical protein